MPINWEQQISFWINHLFYSFSYSISTFSSCKLYSNDPLGFFCHCIFKGLTLSLIRTFALQLCPRVLTYITFLQPLRHRNPALISWKTDQTVWAKALAGVKLHLKEISKVELPSQNVHHSYLVAQTAKCLELFCSVNPVLKGQHVCYKSLSYSPRWLTDFEFTLKPWTYT